MTVCKEGCALSVVVGEIPRLFGVLSVIAISESMGGGIGRATLRIRMRIATVTVEMGYALLVVRLLMTLSTSVVLGVEL